MANGQNPNPTPSATATTPAAAAHTAQPPANPGPSEDLLAQPMKSCSEAAARHGGPPEKIASAAVLCFLPKTAGALHSAAASDPPPTQEPLGAK